jgi:hypothetical protein
VTEEAVGVYRELADGNPVEFLPDLADAVLRLADWLTRQGRLREGWAAGRGGIEAERLGRGVPAD